MLFDQYSVVQDLVKMSIHSKYSNFKEKNTSADISIEEDDFLEPWENLIKHLTSTHIERLHKIFKKKSSCQTLEIYATPVQLSKEEFVEVIDSVLGNSKYSMQAISLYNEIPYSNEEKITWIQFINYYIDNAITKESTDIQLSEPDIFGVPHIKRETIMKIVLLESNTWFCFAIISKYGKVGLYTGNFELLTTYNVVFTRTDTDANDKYRSRKSVWVTDAVFLPNVQILAVCTAARSISFYDASGQKHMPLWLIEGIPNTIECMTYYYDNKNSKLFLGTDDGCVITMNFNKPKEDLLRKKHSDKLNNFFWRELADETAFVTIKTYKKIHTNMIRCIMYYPEYYTFVSCSRDSKNSVVFYNMKERKKNYIFKISQGVNCFALNYDLHIIITGNDNGAVQVWNIYVCSKAIAQLKGHKKSIVDLKILASRNIAITCSSDGVLKTWNLQTFACEQTLTLNYPSFGVLGKSIEWGTSSIYPGPKTSGEEVETNEKIDVVNNEESSRLSKQKKLTKNKNDSWKRSTLLISCCNHIAKMKVVCKSNNESVEHEILPPPPLQNTIMIPDHWRIGHPTFLDTESEETLVRPKPNKLIKKMVKELMGMDFLRDQKLHDKNTKLAALEAKKSEIMKKCVEQCAPFLALDLYELEEIKLSPNLPVPNFRSTQKIADRTQRLLSAASTRSGILSDLSRSSRSSRSSIIEF